MEGDAELRDPEDQEHENRQDDRELDERLPVFAPQPRPDLVFGCHFDEVRSGASAEREALAVERLVTRR